MFKYLRRKAEGEAQKPCFIMSDMGTPLTHAIEKAFLRISWARAIVPGRSQLMALHSHKRNDDALRGAAVVGFTKSFLLTRGLGTLNRSFIAETGQRLLFASAGKVMGDGVRVALWFL